MKKIKKWWNRLSPEIYGSICGIMGVLAWVMIIVMLSFMSCTGKENYRHTISYTIQVTFGNRSVDTISDVYSYIGYEDAIPTLTLDAEGHESCVGIYINGYWSCCQNLIACGILRFKTLYVKIDKVKLK